MIHSLPESYYSLENSVLDKRKTALYFAVENDDWFCTDLLLQYGAHFNIDPVR